MAQREGHGDFLGIKPKEKYFEAFFIALLAAFLFFIPYIIIDKGYFLLYGDFNVQQVPFYKMAHDMVREGNVFWNWNTDLGVNFIGSYSFYLIGSPFFWLTLPFPSEAVPYLMGPLLMLKFACCSLTGYAFIKYFVKNRNFALIGGLLYAFSGFTVYNIFFNHFHEVVVFFPLLLIGIEEFMQNNRKGVFALAVCACVVVNYFFFTGMVVFAVIYWVLRLTSGAWEIDIKKFGLFAFEAVLGMGLAMILLLPSLIVVASNPRTTNTIHGFGALFYDWEQRYGGIISCFFFPPDLPARPNMFPKGEAAWASLGGWLPMFSMVGVFAWLQTKNNWLKKIIITLSICALIPIFNSMFFLFNGAYYGRWFYMLTLMMALATAMAFENTEVNWNRALRWTFGVTLFFTLTIGFITQESPDGAISKIGMHDYGNNDVHLSLWVDGAPVKIGLYEYPDRFWMWVTIAIASLLLTAIVLKYLRKNPRFFAKASVIGVFTITVIYALYFLGTGKTLSYDTRDFIIPYCIEGRKNITIPNIENVRIDGYDPMDNLGMFWQIPSIHAFHSVVPASVMEFYPEVDVERSVGTRPEMKRAALRSLLSVKYMFDYAGDDNNFGNLEDPDEDPKIVGFTYYDRQNNFHIWENQNYIPMGFTYENYITESQFDELTKDFHDRVLLKAILLTNEQIEKYGSLLTNMEDVNSAGYSDYDIEEDCQNRRREAAYYFSRDNYGFDSKIELEKENLVMYSVPYEEGWTATVNGKPVTVEKVDRGLIAIKCEAGDNTVRFNYMTPGLYKGIVITIISMLVFAVYIILMKKLDKLQKEKAALALLDNRLEAHVNEEAFSENRFCESLQQNISKEEKNVVLFEDVKLDEEIYNKDEQIEPQKEFEELTSEDNNIFENEQLPEKEDSGI